MITRVENGTVHITDSGIYEPPALRRRSWLKWRFRLLPGLAALAVAAGAAIALRN